MKLTKYEHACVVLEEQGKKLVIDPGGLTPEFGPLDTIVAVVVTHVHQDHFNKEHLDAILAANPDARLYTTQEVVDQLKRSEARAVKPGQTESAGPFRLEFSGELHALVHKSMPRAQNTAVMVNDTFFYPGDSYTMPTKPVAVLAVPGNAPWMTVGDSIDYILAIKPQRCFPTHNGLLSKNGHMIYNAGLASAAQTAGAEFIMLQPGESLDV